LVENVQVKPSGAAAFDISDNGRLVYATSSGGTTGSRTMVWVDREGREEVTQALPRNYQYPRLSPDDDRVAVSIQDEELDLWVWSFPGETLSRLTFDPTLDFFGHWSPDGNQIFFTSLRSGRGNVYSRNADGTGAVERVSESETNHFLNAITPDGENLIVSEFGEKMGDVARLNVGSAVSDLEPVISTEFNEYNVSLSPDGGWLAYQSNASGREEVYVRPFPDVEGGRWQVSTLGGQDPLWSRDGTELFYWQGNQMMAVPVGTGSAFVAGVPEMLFSGNYYTDLSRTYDVASDGRFLLIKGDGQSGSSLSPSMTVVLNWVDELQERAPSR
jgi:serine/threonine-protein kinase